MQAEHLLPMKTQPSSASLSVNETISESMAVCD
jgi:hypothetical protein